LCHCEDDPEATRDTLPPSPDPVMAAFEAQDQKLNTLLGKVDTLIKMQSAFFDEAQANRRELQEFNERLSALEAVPNGHG
jgi:hypothetical protein